MSVVRLAPGWTRTELVEEGFDPRGRDRFEAAVMARTPVRRWGTPADYGDITVGLLDPALSYHTGDLITVDGGYSIY